MRKVIRPSGACLAAFTQVSQQQGGCAIKKKSERSIESLTFVLRHWEAVPNDRLAHLIKDTTRALVRALQVRLAQHSVSFGHWAFLRILWEQDGVTQYELSAEAGVMEPTTATALRSMEALGYVTRRQVPENRKNMYVYLTPKGRALKRKLVPLAEEVDDIAVSGVPHEDIMKMRRTLIAMMENLSRDDIVSRHSARPRVRATRELPEG